MQKPSVKSESSSQETFLPNFCQPKAAIAALVIIELLAIMLTIPSLGSQFYWNKLLFTSIYIQWIAAICLVFFCLLRPKTIGYPQNTVATICYCTILLITVAVAETAYQITRYTDPKLLPFEFNHLDFLLISLTISAITGLVALRYFYLRHETSTRIEAEAHATLIALQARIKPHFLFNCLNTILSLIRAEPKLAERMLENLAELMRTGLSNVDMLVPFSEELDLTTRYIEMEQLRFGDRLHVELKVDDIPSDHPIPSLSLQPLVENAIYHGIEPLPDGGSIIIEGHYKKENNMLKIKLTNPVPDDRQISFRRKGHHIAMENVKQRLKKHFGNSASLTSHKENYEYTVILCIPFISDTEKQS